MTIEIINEIRSCNFKEKIDKYNPLLIDEIPINFEELFIIEVESRGYLKWETYLNITSRKDGRL